MSHAQPRLGQLAIGNIDTGANNPHGPPSGRLGVEVNATAPGHPAHLAAWANKPELHVEPAIAFRIECSLIKPAHACRILAVDAREGILNPRLADAGETEHAGKFGRVARDPRLWIDREGANTCGLDGQPQSLLVLLHGHGCMSV